MSAVSSALVALFSTLAQVTLEPSLHKLKSPDKSVNGTRVGEHEVHLRRTRIDYIVIPAVIPDADRVAELIESQLAGILSASRLVTDYYTELAIEADATAKDNVRARLRRELNLGCNFAHNICC